MKRKYKDKTWTKKKVNRFLKEKDVEETTVKKEATDGINLKGTLHPRTT
jgi:hypothetical protein